MRPLQIAVAIIVVAISHEGNSQELKFTWLPVQERPQPRSWYSVGERQLKGADGKKLLIRRANARPWMTEGTVPKSGLLLGIHYY